MFRLLTWNVLADAYVRPGFYPNVEPWLLAPGTRTAPIVDYLSASDADVVCLQEIEPRVVSWLRATGEWDVEFAPKHKKPDGLAILARRSATLDDVHFISFVDGDDDTPDSGHIVLCATVRAGGATYELATTHLKWDPPETPIEDRWATRQVCQLLGAFTSIDRAIVCGDLNFEPHGVAYRTLIDAGFVDPMASALVPTANPNGRAKRIDHILCGPALRVRPLPTMRIGDDTPLPSRTMPSDHVPVSAIVDG
ncbi:MAG TPA: endonuclease/exonuclease/phosphatase family protein [Kofleriaceae bacterium]|nr:endonuclease/exonuclease/phosphatase family protein [Kofleriaceae bacterium]